ncbi:potassium-transporting ATPase subunit KdpA [Oryzihumus leptocrescens]|uniref:Potassium-transporting ATPase potassium-binding subunit n=1 Tax=Oryzihumus leptocrescens TaxID=297536 RepID=A0A542ZHB4_9MICO|nr:potassium-transporting ATPase subunit KdpA [Oryzihumus leptocrescens]TQL59767.1 K+-transporting ATPase ATPase A chain [Oryzihumus leptocrescens]
MSGTVSGLLTIGLLVVALAVVHVPLGDWMARVFTDEKHWRVERLLYRAVGVNPSAEQRWTTYAMSVLAFAFAGFLLLFVLILAQLRLPLARGAAGMHVDTAFNTAISFVTNTNWQAYSGETGVTAVTQALGLTVQNFVSAATGLAVVVALIRGLVRVGTDRLGNFWVDLTRATTRILLPIAAVAAVVLIIGGAIQNLDAATTIHTLSGGKQVIEGGLVASQESIKELGTNGGGFFNANSAHPFENPNALTNIFEIFLLLAIPFSLPRTYGVMVGDRRQGYAVLGLMGSLWAIVLGLTLWAETHAAHAVTAAMEGKEQRFGVWVSSLFAVSTTGTSTGAVDSFHESYSPLGGGLLALHMLLGEISPGGVGSGLASALVIVALSVFIAGLMVGRTPEWLGKTIGRKEITLAALTTLVMPVLVLAGTGLALALPASRGALLAAGPHGLTEMLYNYASASNNNGSAFAGMTADSPFFNITLGVCMALGRFLPIVLVLALAGSLAAQHRRPVTAGTMPTHTPLFVSLLVGIAVIVAGLTFFPALALGPIAEALA